jgi:23S rRNA (cytosine1962-C5)-methyltransferase
LLVVNKPAGMNTHAPGPFAGEGLYDWLRHREPRHDGLAIIHRLDKETSGIIVFAKTATANRSLTEQFTRRKVRKKYLLLTDRPLTSIFHGPTARSGDPACKAADSVAVGRVPSRGAVSSFQPAHEISALKRLELVVKSGITRAGERYVSSPQGEPAETRFRPLNRQSPIGNRQLIEAEPLTGRTHQIRVHAAESGFPILGDTLYGGAPAARVCLHAAELSLRHPASGEEMTFHAPVDFAADTRLALRAALIDPQDTDAFRLIHGASDGWPDWYVDRLGDFILSQSDRPLNNSQKEFLQKIAASAWPVAVPASADLAPANAEATTAAPPIAGLQTGAYHKILARQARRASQAEASPQLVSGAAAPERFTIRENGLQYELSFNEGCSVGLFLDQRDNRRRFLTGHIAAEFPLFNLEPGTWNMEPGVLNVFAYTCGFSVCAAKAGARTTSLDLSKKYLEWGKRNFTLNGLDPAAHEFAYGDAFDWLRRLAKKGRAFDVIVLDPPTFSQSKEHGVFRVEKDYGRLVTAAMPLLKAGGVLFASANAAGWEPEKFLAAVEGGVRAAQRKIIRSHYVPQPPDFPVSRSEPAYLKTVWMQLD